MKLIFIPYCVSIVDVDIFFYKVGQTLQGLTLDKSYMRTKDSEGVQHFLTATKYSHS